ncbi:phenoloxidase-activating factor 2 [Drosophila biarmipes]|uniref:phenoloxidase-activating factor 2 n=1 Tax=Drosophila biarmipes TaxID=125945 RepID=UPI0007E8355A|nr:phenoloxidase-activating factor 2 [Drosophila biarmipes]
MWQSVIIFSCLLWVLTEAGAPCGLQLECVPQGLCKPDSWNPNAEITQTYCQRWETCCQSSQVLHVGAPVNCGHSNPNGLDNTTRTFVDQAKPNEFPWIVALMKQKVHFFGAGTLVTENVVVTAAHLVHDKSVNDFVIAGGAWDLHELFRSTVVTRAPARIISHPEFSTITGANNIALIILDVSFEMKPHIGTICWPNSEVSLQQERCVVAGWGVKLSVLSYPFRQKKIDLPLLNKDICEDRLRRMLGRSYLLNPTMLCAGGERGRDACRGDGGSPLMCPVPGHPTTFEFVGIVNSGISCGQENVPGLYTNVRQMKPWIDRHLNEELNKPYKTFPIYDIVYD